MTQPDSRPVPCLAKIGLGDAEITWLEALPHAANEARQEMYCDLEMGHDGPHGAMGQQAGPKRTTKSGGFGGHSTPQRSSSSQDVPHGAQQLPMALNCAFSSQSIPVGTPSNWPPASCDEFLYGIKAPLTRRTVAPGGRFAPCHCADAPWQASPRHPHQSQRRPDEQTRQRPRPAGVTEDQGVKADRLSNSSSARNLRCGNTLPAAIFSCVMAQFVKVVRPVGRSTLTSLAITRTWHR